MPGNKVRFTYVSTGSQMPAHLDGDTIYFLEEDKEIRVGSYLFSKGDAIDLDTFNEELEMKTSTDSEVDEMIDGVFS